MTLYTKSFIAACIIMSFPALTSCSSKEDISGQWIGQNMEINGIPAAATANETTTLVFSPIDKQTKTGNVNISSLISVSQSVAPIQSTLDYPYEVNIAATSSISGTYVYAKDEDDDIIITFDPQSLNVVVDPSGVTFSQNLISGMEQPSLDSMNLATVDRWKGELSRAMRLKYNAMSKIDDIEIHHGTTMTLEINDKDYTFSKAAQN